eukprot:COSAG01_NODE_42684_length_437_cov_1.849112_1_plen_41_part_10
MGLFTEEGQLYSRLVNDDGSLGSIRELLLRECGQHGPFADI